MTDRIARQIAFLNEADRLKSVLRSNVLQDLSRRENSAEHSWHVALYALAFAPVSPDGVSVPRAIQMLLLHDLVEIDVGDHPIHENVDWAEVAAREEQAARRLFSLLPQDQAADCLALWTEFEAGETPDAAFAKMLDHSQPLFQALCAPEPLPEHVEIVRENLDTGRARRLQHVFPAAYAHANALLHGTPASDAGDVTTRIDFLNEADRLKSVMRATMTLDAARQENSGEHSWHIALYAMILAEHANRPVNADRVIQMLLIHDLVEIDVGDVPIHSQDGAAHGSAEIQEAEARAADRIFGLLPADQAAELRTLWEEFEAAESDDAVFAKSIDRVQPCLANLKTGGRSWVDYNVTYEQVEARVGTKVTRGAPAVWAHLQVPIRAWFEANT